MTTEGIIQKVIKTYLNEYSHIDDILSDLEQELITEIKKQCDKHHEDGEEYPDIISRYELIGDNQE